jgi:hypothetical protein
MSRFIADELMAAGLIGCVRGECREDRFIGSMRLVSIDWQESFFSREDCESGELVALDDKQRDEVFEAVAEAISDVCDNPRCDLVVVPSRLSHCGRTMLQLRVD